MKPVAFPEQNIVWAENQPPFKPLPAYTSATETISCWQLTWRERLTLVWRGCIWLRQMNMGDALQPQCMSVESPWAKR
jgi:hypothetical protein